ncbi:MAG: DEAD/DEAH box helicase, partial [Acidimicrobiales bacterium]
RRRRLSELDELTAAVAAGPGRTPTELRDVLRAAGRVSVTAADVARVLTGHPGRFAADGHMPPRWWPVPPGPTRPTPAPASPPAAAGRGLYAWQREALDAWRAAGGRGVVEAVTGSGKTMVGVAALTDELARGGQVCVLVPTSELLMQWHEVLTAHLPAAISVGLLGGGHRSGLGDHDVLVAVVNSARDADLRPRRPGGLLVADECHRYGSESNRAALADGFARRLGLSATYERPDEAHLVWLDPYFGGTCFRMGYRRAIADGVMARFTVALVGVAFDPGEQSDYRDLCRSMSSARARLIDRHDVPPEPVGVFLQAVARLAGSGDDGASAARSYLAAMAERRRLLAETPAKVAALHGLLPALWVAGRSIVFTQTIAAAGQAASALRSRGLRCQAIHSGLDAGTRRTVLADFAAGRLQVVTAPQVLDEGVDVPTAGLASSWRPAGAAARWSSGWAGSCAASPTAARPDSSSSTWPTRWRIRPGAPTRASWRR